MCTHSRTRHTRQLADSGVVLKEALGAEPFAVDGEINDYVVV